ncbi:MAG: hypothetical protein HIU90_07725 [Proteobacteria bacterium]|nr:hypothetical protein [Pseudomonadota bacterium]
MDGIDFVPRTFGTPQYRVCPEHTDQIEAQLASGSHLKDAAYRIRYEAYNSYGFVPQRQNGIFSDAYDERSNCQTALVFKHGVAAATIRIASYDPESFNTDYHFVQAMEIFEAEIKSALGQLRPGGRKPRAVEIGKLARLPGYAKDLDILFALFRAVGYLILNRDVDVVFNAVRSHHMPTYRRFGFRQLEAPRQYPGLTFKTGLMACFRTSYDQARNNLPFLRGISTDDAAYHGLIAGERVPIFGAAPALLSAVRRPEQTDRPSQTPDALHNRA